MNKLSCTGIIFLIAYILIFVVFPLGIICIVTDPVFKNADSDTNTKN